MEVSLLCKVNILNGIEKWQNVSYKIEWFAEGKSLKSEEICGGLPPGEVNDKPCPSGELHSTLEPALYKIGQLVRPIYAKHYRYINMLETFVTVIASVFCYVVGAGITQCCGRIQNPGNNVALRFTQVLLPPQKKQRF